MADTDIVFTGFYQAIGHLVTATIGGLDAGDYIVAADGSVTVPINQDPDQLCNGDYLATLDVGPFDRVTYGDATATVTLKVGLGNATIYIPVVIGYTYPTWGQLLRPATEAQTKSSQGPALGKTRRVHMFAALMVNAVGVSWGTNFNTLSPAIFRDAAGNAFPHNRMFSAVYQDTITEADSLDGMIAWQVSRPYPCTISAISGFVETSER